MDVAALAARLAETFSAEQRAQLIAALLAAQPAPPPGAPLYQTSTEHAPVPAAITEVAPLQAGPPIAADTPNEAEDSPEERARLLAILAANPSGLSGYTLLDAYRIPPPTIEFAMRDGQATRAERGIGLARAYGGPW